MIITIKMKSGCGLKKLKVADIYIVRLIFLFSFYFFFYKYSYMQHTLLKFVTFETKKTKKQNKTKVKLIS